MKTRKQNGVAAVELALIFIPLLLLCFGITELGRALFQYDGLVKSARGAARYLSQQSLASPPAGETADSVRLKAKSLALCGEYSCTGKPALVSGLSIGMISVCDPVACPGTHQNVLTGEGSVSLVSVNIGSSSSFSFSSMVPWAIASFSFGPIAITMASSAN